MTNPFRSDVESMTYSDLHDISSKGLAALDQVAKGSLPIEPVVQEFCLIVVALVRAIHDELLARGYEADAQNVHDEFFRIVEEGRNRAQEEAIMMTVSTRYIN